MNSDEARIVAVTYRRFLAVDAVALWDPVDDVMCDHLDRLTDDEIAKEADIAYFYHTREGADARCRAVHGPNEKCAVPDVLKSVKALIDHYVRVGGIDSKMRYILQFYVAMDQTQMIVYNLK